MQTKINKLDEDKETKYNYERDGSHLHCWLQKQPSACGQPLEGHKQCCLCPEKLPIEKEEENHKSCVCGKEFCIGGAEVEIGGVCHRPNNPCYMLPPQEDPIGTDCQCDLGSEKHYHPECSSFKELHKHGNYGKKTGKNNHNWKGDKVGYTSLHEWVSIHYPKKEFCEMCGKVPPRDIANISQEYKRDLDDWEWLCRSCHMKKDGRMEKLYKNHQLWLKNKKK